MATVYVGSARSDENGKAYGGKAGDQKSGREVSKQEWYLHNKGWRVFRAKDAKKAAIIGDQMQAACDNNKIGYDQHERYDLYAEAKKVGFDLAKVSVATECDCSELVRCCCAAAGIHDLPTSGFRTGNMPANLMATGEFIELTGSQYTNQSAYLGKGDILVTKTSGHTVVVLNNGSKYGASTTVNATFALGDRVLKKGMKGDDVKALQKSLIDHSYSCGKWGADGDFGKATEDAVKKFQKDHGCGVDGIYGKETHKAMQAATPTVLARVLKKGMKGNDVKSLQNALIKLGHNCGKWGADGDFGSATEIAVKDFQKAHGCKVDGIYGADTHKAMLAAQKNAANETNTPAAYVQKGKIADVSKWQGSIDWAKAATELDFCILRAAYQQSKDTKFDDFVNGCKANKIPFAVYQYSMAKSVEDALEEADYLWSLAKSHNPTVWFYDCEEEGINRGIVSAWVQRMRKLGAKRIGLYIAHHRYAAYNLDVSEVDCVWIPRYGSNDGKQHTKPDFACDLWQYTSAGSLAGVSGNVDLNIVTGDGKSLMWFRGGE